MKKLFLTDTLVVLIAFTYSVLFWKEKMGLNLLIFAIVLTVSVLVQYSVKDNPYLKLTAFGTLLTAVMVVWQNSLVSKVIHILSLLAMIGFAQQHTLRFFGYAFLLALFSMWETPRKFLRQFNENFGTALRPSRLAHHFYFSLVPVGLLVLFYVIYYVANSKFAEISDKFWNDSWWFIYTYFPIQRLLLFVLGGLIAGSVLWRTSINYFQQVTPIQNLLRYTKHDSKKSFPILGLKREFGQSVLLLSSLNLLLFIVNAIDIMFVWWNDSKGTASQMRQYVHEGTYLLIVAILLAMVVLLYYFRDKLNFYPKSSFLRGLAYIWLAQNFVLTLSVAMRNFAYIEQYNLAYKRIGVFIFLTSVIVGLVTLFLKIKHRKTMYFLLQQNSLAAYLIWLVICCINWDVCITEYNLRKGAVSGMDAHFLIEEVSDKNLFLLLQYQNTIAAKNYNPLYHYDNFSISRGIAYKKILFIKRQATYCWLSWNYPDYRNQQALKQLNGFNN